MARPKLEFNCVECGRLIVRFVEEDTLGLCAMCISLPGWFRIPEIREVVDPDMEPPPALENYNEGK